MTYLIEAVVNGDWQYFAGRLDDGSRLSGLTKWSATTDHAKRYETKQQAKAEVRRLGGTAYIREAEGQELRVR